MSKKGVLFVFGDHIEAITAVGADAGQQQALATRPDVIVVGPGFSDTLAICEQLHRAMPPGYRPTVVIDSPHDVIGARTDRSISVPPSGATDNGRNDGVPTPSTADTVSCHGLEIYRQKFFAAIDGRELDLTATEFLLVWTLSQHPGQVFSRKQLTDACRGEDADVLERTIDVHVRSVRKKLGHRADLIETVRGVGYRFRDCPEPSIKDGRLTCAKGHTNGGTSRHQNSSTDTEPTRPSREPDRRHPIFIKN